MTPTTPPKPLKSRRFVAAVVAAGVLAGGAIGLTATLPSAAGAAPGEAPAESAAPSSDDGKRARHGDRDKDRDNGRDRGRRGKRGAKHQRGAVKMVAQVAEVLELERVVLIDKLRSGQTVAEIIVEQGKDVDDITAKLEAAAAKALDDAVAAGHIGDERAATLKKNLSEKVAAMVNGDLPMHSGFGRRGMQNAPGFAAVAEALSIDTKTLAAELRSGKSIADLAAEQDVDTATIAKLMADAADTRIAAAVEAGRLTEDEAAEKRATLAERIDERINTRRLDVSERGEGRNGRRGSAERPSEASPNA